VKLPRATRQVLPINNVQSTVRIVRSWASFASMTGSASETYPCRFLPENVDYFASRGFGSLVQGSDFERRHARHPGGRSTNLTTEGSRSAMEERLTTRASSILTSRPSRNCQP